MTEKKEEVYSTAQHLKLISFEPEIYAGFKTDEGSNFIIFFENNRVLGFEGDQGQGKTSLLKCAMELLGAPPPDNAINSVEKKKSATLTWENLKNGRKYVTRVTNRSFTITHVQEDDGSKAKIESPKEFLREIVGPLGVNPMELKEMSGEKQIEWLRDLFKLTEEQKKAEDDVLKKIKDTYSQRRQINNDMKRIRATLLNSGLFEYKEKEIIPKPEYDKTKALYAQDVKEREKQVYDLFNKTNEAVQQFNRIVATSESEKKQKSDVEKEINTLEMRIKSLREQKEAIEKNLIKREEEIVSIMRGEFEGMEIGYEMDNFKNANPTADLMLISKHIMQFKLEKAQEKMKKVTDYKAGKQAFDLLEKERETYSLEEDAYQKEHSKLQELERHYQTFIKAFTPEIPGLAVCVPKVVDVATEQELYVAEHPEATEEQVREYVMGLKNERRTGIYLNERSVTELSESETWDLAMRLWMLMGVKVIFIENINVLGSDAIARINELKEKGCYVFFTAMERKLKTLKATFFDDKIEELEK